MTQNLPTVHSMGELEKMAGAIVKSNLFGVKSIDQAVTLMLVAQAEGLHPATAARDYHVIQGRPALKADAMLARFQNAGGKVEWEDYTDAKVSARFSHPQSPKPVLIEWTLDMAKKIGLTGKDNWKNYPRAMLRARVISEGVRTCYPAIATGIYTPEEVSDFPEKDVTPTGGVLSTLPIKRQEIIMETAQEIKAYLANNQHDDAYALWQNSKFDADESVGLWSLLDSKQRGILDRMGDAERSQNSGVISEAKRKRLEALIKEKKLDREAVKKYCKEEFGAEHFTELSNEAYGKLDIEISHGNPAFTPSGIVAAPQQSPAGAPPSASETTEGAAATDDAKIDADQLRNLLLTCEQSGVKVERVLLKAKITKAEDMLASDYQGALKWIAGQAKAKAQEGK